LFIGVGLSTGGLHWNFMSFTVVPLHNLDLPAGTRVAFGKGFVLQDTPAWVKADKGTLADINRNDRNLVLDGKHALVGEYEAEGLGHPDPDWKGEKPKSIQELKFQSAMLANLAIWLRQPSIVCFTVCFHALSRIDWVAGCRHFFHLVNRVSQARTCALAGDKETLNFVESRCDAVV
jgi:hypothetical protein